MNDYTLAWLGLALLLIISAAALIGRRYPRIAPVDAEPCDRCTGGPLLDLCPDCARSA